MNIFNPVILSVNKKGIYLSMLFCLLMKKNISINVILSVNKKEINLSMLFCLLIKKEYIYPCYSIC